MIRVGSIVIRVDDLHRLAEFWRQALQYERRIDRHDYVLLAPAHGDGPNVAIDAMRSTAQTPPRIHLDLYADDQASGVERLISLGATEVLWDKRPTDADYVILADPRATDSASSTPATRTAHSGASGAVVT